MALTNSLTASMLTDGYSTQPHPHRSLYFPLLHSLTYSYHIIIIIYPHTLRTVTPSPLPTHTSLLFHQPTPSPNHLSSSTVYLPNHLFTCPPPTLLLVWPPPFALVRRESQRVRSTLGGRGSLGWSEALS